MLWLKCCQHTSSTLSLSRPITAKISAKQHLPDSNFLFATRLLLARQPLLAHLCAALLKVAKAELESPFAVVWEGGRPALHYNESLFPALQRHPDWLGDWLEETLIHLLLGHQEQEQEFNEKWAFHLACDLEAGQYHSRWEQHDLRPLVHRLHLSSPFTLLHAYEAILQLAQASRNTPLPALVSMPVSRLSHRYWSLGGSGSRLGEIQLWRANLQNLLKYQAPLAGSHFMNLYNQLLSVGRPATLSWQVLLRRFALTGARAHWQASLRRPSKRYHTFPGHRRTRANRLAVIVDTSGSIAVALRQRFFAELQHLQPLVHAIDVIEADYEVRRTYPFGGQLPEWSAGGGATAFDPAIAYVNQQQHFDGVIYFTDGEGPAPQLRCRFPMVWLLAEPGQVLRASFELPQ